MVIRMPPHRTPTPTILPRDHSSGCQAAAGATHSSLITDSTTTTSGSLLLSTAKSNSQSAREGFVRFVQEYKIYPHDSKVLSPTHSILRRTCLEIHAPLGRRSRSRRGCASCSTDLDATIELG